MNVRAGGIESNAAMPPMLRECWGCGVECEGLGRLCPDCRRQEFQLYLRGAEAAPDEAVEEIAEAQGLRRAARFVLRWLWVPELVLVIGALVYLGAVFGAAVLQWMGWL